MKVLEIDIVVISKNVSDYIYDCLESCLCDSYNLKKNIYVIDDGSTDGTKEIIKKFSDGISEKIIFLETNSIGSAQVRNFFLDNYAKSDFISFVDGDDFISSQNLSDIIHIMHMLDADFSCPKVISFDNDMKFVLPHDVFHLRQEICGDRLFLCTNSKFEPKLLGLETSMCMRIFKRKFLDENRIRFDNIDFCEDVFPSRKCFILANSIAIINIPYYYYRVNRPGQRTSLIDEKSKDFLIAFRKSIDFALKNNITDEQGGWLLYKLCSSAIWTRNLINLEKVHSYIEEINNCFEFIPRKWWKSLYAINSLPENVRFLAKSYLENHDKITRYRCVIDQKLSVNDKIKTKIRKFITGYK